MSHEKVNILLITSDQQHWSAIGYNNPEVKTPNLDRLAEQGTIFTRAYCPNPTCTPTRASLITGRYPSQHGAYSLGTKLPESAHTVGEDFIRAGYRTALIGKAHFQPLRGTDTYPSLESYPILQDLDFWRQYDDVFYGFEHVELARNHTDEAHVGQHYALWLEEKGCLNWRDYFRSPTGNNDQQKRTWLIPEQYHYDAWIAERTSARLERYAENGENFFLWASFFDPHPKYLVPEPWDKMYNPDKISVPGLTPGEHDRNPPHFQMTQKVKPDFSAWRESDGNGMHGFHSHLHNREELAKDIAIYYSMISLMDKYIGSILDKLDALGLAENTLVVFTTDHGHFYGHHGLIAKGAFHYEDMIKVPMIARLPGRIPAGRNTDALQTLVDFAPTFLSITQHEIPRSMTGIDQRDVWFGEKKALRDQVIVENRHQPTTLHLKTLVNRRYKLTVYYGRDYGELFDLETDPGENNNLWADPDYAELKADLVMKLLQAEMGKEPVWMPRIAAA
jgi:arylsulfatase A-like enzyme